MFWLFVKKPEEIKIILNAEETFDKSDHGVNMFLEYGLLTDCGEKYKLQRRTIMPFFGLSNLKKFFPSINEKMDEFIERFDRELPSKEFDLTPYTLDFSLSAILKSFLDIDHVSIEERSKLIEAFRMIGHIASVRIFKFWLAINFIFKHSKYYGEWTKHRKTGFGYVEQVIKENEENFQSGRPQTKQNTLVDLLYQIRGSVSYEEMVQSVYLLISAGFETSGVSMSNVLLILAMNQDKQEECYQEIRSVLTSSEEKVTEEKYDELKHLERCIKEGLRLIAPVLALSRKVKKDLKLGQCSLNHQKYIYKIIQ